MKNYPCKRTNMNKDKLYYIDVVINTLFDL